MFQREDLKWQQALVGKLGDCSQGIAPSPDPAGSWGSVGGMAG